MTLSDWIEVAATVSRLVFAGALIWAVLWVRRWNKELERSNDRLAQLNKEGHP